MQITNNKTTIDLDENILLNLILDEDQDKLERVVKDYYQVNAISKLPAEGVNVLIYLTVVVQNKKAAEIAEIYNLTKHEIIAGAKEIFSRTHTNKQFYGVVYEMYINFRQLQRGLFESTKKAS